jgi:transposase-like protein
VVPRHRDIPFKSLIFDNYKRSEGALVTTMAEMVVAGVSTRKVAKVVETLCGTTYSKSMVSEVCKDLDEAVQTFRNRPLNMPYPFVFVDATYFKVRQNHRIISKALMVAYATNSEGLKEVIGFDLYDNESNDTWFMFIESLKRRGLHGVRIITSDAHPGILYAIKKVYPDVPWQRCQTHFSRNIMDKTPAKYQKGLQSELSEMYNAPSLQEAIRIKNRIMDDYSDVAQSAVECLDAGFDSIMTVMVLPKSLRKFHRTSNHIERLNRELKRRSDVIGVFPNEASVIRLMGSVLMDLHEDAMSRKGRGYPISQLALVDDCLPALKQIALEQEKLLVA